MMLDFLVENIFVTFRGCFVNNSSALTTNCAPLPADLFLYSYEANRRKEILHNPLTSLSAI